MATFANDLILDKAGSYTLIATDGSDALATSNSFIVSPAAASKLVFSSLPSAAAHGSTFAVQLAVEDSFGNVLTNDNAGTITIALGSTHPKGAILTGTLTQSVVGGVGTFAALSVNEAGSYLHVGN